MNSCDVLRPDDANDVKAVAEQCLLKSCDLIVPEIELLRVGNDEDSRLGSVIHCAKLKI